MCRDGECSAGLSPVSVDPQGRPVQGTDNPPQLPVMPPTPQEQSFCKHCPQSGVLSDLELHEIDPCGKTSAVGSSDPPPLYSGVAALPTGGLTPTAQTLSHSHAGASHSGSSDSTALEGTLPSQAFQAGARRRLDSAGVVGSVAVGGPVEKSWEVRVGQGLEPGTPHGGSGRHRGRQDPPGIKPVTPRDLPG